jgi:hypothetical protein
MNSEWLQQMIEREIAQRKGDVWDSLYADLARVVMDICLRQAAAACREWAKAVSEAKNTAPIIAAITSFDRGQMASGAYYCAEQIENLLPAAEQNQGTR